MKQNPEEKSTNSTPMDFLYVFFNQGMTYNPHSQIDDLCY